MAFFWFFAGHPSKRVGNPESNPTAADAEHTCSKGALLARAARIAEGGAVDIQRSGSPEAAQSPEGEPEEREDTPPTRD